MRRLRVTYWEDDINCVDEIEIEYTDREEFKEKMFIHATHLADEGYHIAGMRYNEELV